MRTMLSRSLILLALTLAAAAPAPEPSLSEALAATIDTACVPVLSREIVWPLGPDKLAEEDALFARLGLTRGVPQEFYTKLLQISPRGDGISGAILADRTADDGAFAFVLGGTDASCRLLVYRTRDSAALAKAIEAELTRRGWKYVASPPTRSPKRVLVRRTVGGGIAMAHIVTPAAETPITPLVVVNVLPPGTRVPPELAL